MGSLKDTAIAPLPPIGRVLDTHELSTESRFVRSNAETGSRPAAAPPVGSLAACLRQPPHPAAAQAVRTAWDRNDTLTHDLVRALILLGAVVVMWLLADGLNH